MLFISFTYLKPIVRLENKFSYQLSVNRKTFGLATHTRYLSISNIDKLSSSWMLGAKILYMAETLKTKC